MQTANTTRSIHGQRPCFLRWQNRKVAPCPHSRSPVLRDLWVARVVPCLLATQIDLLIDDHAWLSDGTEELSRDVVVKRWTVQLPFPVAPCCQTSRRRATWRRLSPAATSIIHAAATFGIPSSYGRCSFRWPIVEFPWTVIVIDFLSTR